MSNNFAYEFQPDEELMQCIGIAGVESSGRDGIKLWQAFRKSALWGLKDIREKYPDKYTSGLHIYIGEYNDHLWLCHGHVGEFLTTTFLGKLEAALPEEHFVLEESTEPMVEMVYSYYPNRILVFDDGTNGETLVDKKYGTHLELTQAELFPEDMRRLVSM